MNNPIRDISDFARGYKRLYGNFLYSFALHITLIIAVLAFGLYWIPIVAEKVLFVLMGSETSFENFSLPLFFIAIFSAFLLYSLLIAGLLNYKDMAKWFSALPTHLSVWYEKVASAGRN